MNETDSKLAKQKLAEDKSQSFLANYAGSPAASSASEADEYQAFIFGRVASRSQPMLTFYKNDDYVEAISYANLNRIWTSDINRELKLDFGDRQVRIEGDSLSQLFDYLCTNRCAAVVEQTKQEALSVAHKDPKVLRIEIYCRRKGE